MNERHSRNHSVWKMPLLLGVVSAAGLTAALVHDGAGDWLSWIALAVPVAVCLWYSGLCGRISQRRR